MFLSQLLQVGIDQLHELRADEAAALHENRVAVVRPVGQVVVGGEDFDDVLERPLPFRRAVNRLDSRYVLDGIGIDPGELAE